MFVFVLFRILLFFALAWMLYRIVARMIGARTARTSSTPQDPYSLLGLKPGASETEIKEAYHAQIAKYHPDKVAHLGEDLQLLARQKSQAIIEAYESLRFK